MSFKKCQVVMLPTNEKATIFKILNIDKLCIGANEIPNFGDRHQNQHLYITSEDKIKEGDWFLFELTSIQILQCVKIDKSGIKSSKDKWQSLEHCKKIIATTDSSLTKEMYSISFGKYQEPLPQPSQAFIEKYVEKYNKGNQITDVLVEYVDNGHEDWCERTDQPIWVEKLVPYINNKDHTITIKKMKDSWSRDEHITNLIKYREEFEEFKKNCHFGPNQKEIDQWTYKWIEENL